MPIYAYKCESCGFAKDVLQKISDTPLADCPTCGKPTFKKQLTAAGFQLKGTGWYATDFKGGNTSAPAVAATGDAKGDTKGDTKGDVTAPSTSDAPKSDAPAAAPVSAPETLATPAKNA